MLILVEKQRRQKLLNSVIYFLKYYLIWIKHVDLYYILIFSFRAVW
jgi:hypothetical protein